MTNAVLGVGLRAEPLIGIYGKWIGVWGWSPSVTKIYGSQGDVCGSPGEAGVIGSSQRGEVTLYTVTNICNYIICSGKYKKNWTYYSWLLNEGMIAKLKQLPKRPCIPNLGLQFLSPMPPTPTITMCIGLVGELKQDK